MEVLFVFVQENCQKIFSFRKIINDLYILKILLNVIDKKMLNNEINQFVRNAYKNNLLSMKSIVIQLSTSNSII